jgi:hypothetical protein
MNGEGDVRHYLSEYFGSCRSGVGTGALTSVLAQIRRATRHRLVGWRVAGAPRRFPPRSFGLCPAQTACNLLPAVLGSELAK